MKTNFERGQLNAQDDLNTNFTEINNFMYENFPVETIFTGSEGKFSGAGKDGLDIGFGSTQTKIPSTEKNYFSYDSTNHSLKVEIAGKYKIEVSSYIHIQMSTNSGVYFYWDIKKNNSTTVMNVLQSQASGYKQHASNFAIVDLEVGDILTCRLGTNYTGNIPSAYIESISLKFIQ